MRIVSMYIQKFLQERRNRIRFGGILILLALLVAGLVFWRLHYTGVAMTNEVYCGQEEHTHDESCYDLVLTCGLEESEGNPGHTHDESCYETVSVLVCGLEESEGHVHDEETCFDGEGNLTCTIPETEGHTHTEECYETTQNLICGLEESAAVEGHTHTDECYTEVLTCGMEEHVHTISCMMDETADLETADDWLATLPEEKDLTGVWAEDVVAVAESQLGYAESEANFVLDEDGETRRGYTRYGQWYGNEYGDWSAMFASFCLYYGGVSADDLPYFPYNSGAYPWTVALTEAGLYEDAGDHTPAAGDLVFLNTDEGKNADTVAVISEVVTDRNDKVTALKVIQGDHNDAVEEYMIEIDDETILGYGVLPEQPVEETETEEDLEVTAVTTDENGAVEDTAETAASEEIDGVVTDGSAVVETYSAKQDTGSTADSDVPHGGVETGADYSTASTNSGIVPLADDDTAGHEYGDDDSGSYDHHGDVIITGVTGESTATYNPETGNYEAAVRVDFSVNTQDLTYDEETGKWDEAWFYLPDGVEVPSNYVDTGIIYVGKDGNGTQAFLFGFVTDEDGNVRVYIEFMTGYYDLDALENCYIEFTAEFSEWYIDDEGNLRIPTLDEYDFDLGIEPGQSAAPGGDIKTEKSGSYNGETGTLDYTVTISSTQGTGSEVVTVTDVLTVTGDMVIEVGSTIQMDVTYTTEGKTTTSTVTAYVTETSTGVFTITYELPAMEKNSSYTVSYSFEVTEPDNVTVNPTLSAGNTVKAEVSAGADGPEIDIEDEDSSYVYQKFYDISKSGSNGGNDIINWTIVVNESGADIAGYEVTDDLFAEALDGITVQIRNSDWSTSDAPRDSYEIVTNSDGSVSIKFLGDPNTYTYVITYSTEADDGYLGETNDYRNTADLGEDGVTKGEGVADDWEVSGSLTKEYKNCEDDGNGDHIIHWSSSITLPTKGIQAGTVIFDSLETISGSNNYQNVTDQWYTYEQISSLLGSVASSGITFADPDGSGSVTIPASDLTIEVYDKTTGGWVYYANANQNDVFTAWRITIGNAYEPDEGGSYEDYVWNFDYDTTANTSDLASAGSAGLTFWNRITVGDLYAEDHDTERTSVIKTDANGNVGTSSVTVTDDGLLTWIVQIYIPEGYDEGMTVTDYLPVGTSVTQIQISGKPDNNGSNGISLTLNDSFEWSNTVTVHDNAHSADVTGTISATPGSYTTDDERTAQSSSLTIPSSITGYFGANGGGTIQITYTIQVSEEDLALLMGDEETAGTTISYTNHVEVDDGVYGEATQTEDATYHDPTQDKKILSKEGYYGGNGDYTLSFNVLINPDEKDLSDEEYLTLVDSMNVANGDVNGGMTVVLEQNSVKFWRITEAAAVKESVDEETGYGMYEYVDDNGNVRSVIYSEENDVIYIAEDETAYYKIELMDVAWTYSYESGYLYTITAQVPDGTKILMEYKYDVFWTENSKEGYQYWAQNTVKLEGVEDSEYVNEQSGWTGDTTIGGGTEHLPGVTIHKVEQGHFGVVASGAKFELYYWDGSQWVNTNLELISDENGLINLTDEMLKQSGVYHENTGYYLVEVESPVGYILEGDQEGYYFYFGADSATAESPLGYPNDWNTAITTNVADYNWDLYIENTPAPKESVGVQKVWISEDEDTGERTTVTKDLPDSVTMQLYYYLSDRIPEGVAEEAAGDGITLYIYNDSKYSYDAYSIGSDQAVRIWATYNNSSTSGGESVQWYIWRNSEWGVTYASENDYRSGGLAEGEIIFDVTIPVSDFTSDFYVRVLAPNSGCTIHYELVESDVNPDANPFGGYDLYGGYAYTNDDGNAVTVTLTKDNNWSATVSELPEYIDVTDVTTGETTRYYYYYYFQETSISGGWGVEYETYPVGENNQTFIFKAVDGIGSDDNTLTVTNVTTDNPSYQLPSSGGPGLAPFYALGAAFLAAAGGIGLKISRKRRKGGEA